MNMPTYKKCMGKLYPRLGRPKEHKLDLLLVFCARYFKHLKVATEIAFS